VKQISRRIRRFEVELAETLSTLERILVRLVVFAVFIVGLYVVTAALLRP
jgi:hypothetical protein